MVRVLGIDPGTVSLDLCGLEDGRVFLDRVIPTGTAQLAEEAVAAIADAGPLDLVLGPSGYGLPLTPIAQVGERELRLAFLPQPGGDAAGIDGLRALVERLRRAGLPLVFGPGVKHLPTVPAHRKANLIDLGTADKVCAAALGIHDQATRLGCAPDETAFLLVEVGGAFSAVLAVEGGAIVDGRGGSSGPPGYLAAGALDGEVACLLGRVDKRVVFSGGAADLAADGMRDDAPTAGGPAEARAPGSARPMGGAAPALPPAEALATRQDRAAREARAYLIEGVVRAAAGELALVPGAREILLSGRLARQPGWGEALERALARLAPVRRVGRLAPHSKEAAQGAALLADGLAGGGAAAIVQALRLREASGTVLDHLHLAGAAAARERLLAWPSAPARS